MRIIQSFLLILLVISLLLFSGTYLADKTILTPAQANDQFKQLSLSSDIAQIKASDISQLTSLVNTLLESNNKSALHKEKLLHAIAEHISQQEPRPEYRTLLNELAGYQSTVYWQMDDGGRPQLMLAYPIAGLATATSTHWRMNDDVERLAPGQRLDMNALDDYLNTADKFEALEVFNRLITRLPMEQKQLLAGWVSQGHEKLTAGMMFSLAEQLSDKAIYQKAVNQLMSRPDERPVASNLTNYLNAMKRQLPVSDGNDLLLQLTYSEQYGSLAIQQLSDRRSPAIHARLFSLLNHKRLGGDAALVLSRELDTEMLTKLEKHLSSPDILKSRRSLIVLKHSDNPLAEQMLDAYLARQPETQLSEEAKQ